jgi:hypothetical protein
MIAARGAKSGAAWKAAVWTLLGVSAAFALLLWRGRPVPRSVEIPSTTASAPARTPDHAPPLAGPASPSPTVEPYHQVWATLSYEVVREPADAAWTGVLRRSPRITADEPLIEFGAGSEPWRYGIPERGGSGGAGDRLIEWAGTAAGWLFPAQGLGLYLPRVGSEAGLPFPVEPRVTGIGLRWRWVF